MRSMSALRLGRCTKLSSSTCPGVGPQGEKGINGYIGYIGYIGYVGPEGEKGSKGAWVLVRLAVYGLSYPLGFYGLNFGLLWAPLGSYGLVWAHLVSFGLGKVCDYYLLPSPTLPT